MPRFLTGDELGNIKSLRHSPGENKIEVKTIHNGMANDRPNSIDALAITSYSGSSKLVRFKIFSDLEGGCL